MIGLLPFLINNLNPDLQTEVSLAVQPLRVENSDLRRYVPPEIPLSCGHPTVWHRIVGVNIFAKKA